jgi:hypothetical protein
MNQTVRFLIPICLLLGLTSADLQATPVTYQGQLQQQGLPFSGTANLEFRLFDSIEDGSQLGLGQTFVNHPVEGGLFQVELEFSTTAFSAGERFMEVWVNGAPLTPRQAINAAPLALHALNVPESVSPFSLDPVTNNVTHVTARQAIRFEPRTGPEPFFFDTPSVTFGHPTNMAAAAGSAVLSGGAGTVPNIASGEHSVVVGGINNQALGYRSFVGGGSTNGATSMVSAVVGGIQNYATGNTSFVGGGQSNNAAGLRATVSGGWLNCAGGHMSWAGGTRSAVRLGTDAGNAEQGCSDVPLTGTLGGDSGTFVWADFQGDKFISSGTNQFLVRALGGALITGDSAVNSPAGNRLRVNGTLRVDNLGAAGETQLCRNVNNQLAACSSSARYKKDIEALDIDADLIDRLRPVQYRWTDSGQPDIGFVAEEIAEILPELVTRNDLGQIEGIKYDRMTALLVQAIKQHRIQQLQTESLLAELQAENRKMKAQVAALEAQGEHSTELVLGNAGLEARLATLESLLFDGRRFLARP